MRALQLAALLAALAALLLLLASPQAARAAAGGAPVDTKATMKAGMELSSGGSGSGGDGSDVQDSDGSGSSSDSGEAPGDTLPYTSPADRPAAGKKAAADPKLTDDRPNFGRGKLTVIRNENNFVTKVRERDRTKVEEQKLKISVANEAKNKQAEAFNDLAKKRAEDDRLEKAKEKYEAVAEQANKKTQEEGAKLQEAGLKARLDKTRKALAKKAAHHRSMPEFQVRVRYADDYCLNLRHGRRVPGTPITLWKCKPRSHAQRWKFYRDGTIRLAVDHKWCVELARASARANDRLRLNRCRPGRRQMWKRLSDGSLRFVASPKLAVTLHKGVIANGQHVQMERRRHADPAQEWVVAPVRSKARYAPPRLVTLRDQFLRDACVNLRRTSMRAGAKITAMRCRHSHAQLWRYDSRDSTVRLARRPAFCLEVKDGRRAQNQPVQLGLCGGRPRARQRWVLQDGYFRLKDYRKWVLQVGGGRGSGFPPSGTGLTLSTAQSARRKWQQWQVRSPNQM